MVGWETPAALATSCKRSPAGPPTAISASAASRINRRASAGLRRTRLFLLVDFLLATFHNLTIDNIVDNRHGPAVETRTYAVFAQSTLDTRLRPLEAVKAVRRLMANPEATEEVFVILRAMRGRSGIALFRRFQQSP